MKKTIVVIFYTFLISTCIRSSADFVQNKLSTIPQNALVFLRQQNNNYQIQPPFKKQLKKNYLHYYFLPWQHSQLLLSNKDVLTNEQQLIDAYSQTAGWSENGQKQSPAWIHAIATNMDLKTFPNFIQNAITINPSDLREMPTLTPSFGNPKKAGEGYPFDNLQGSRLTANEPIEILHTSQDGAWDLIIAPDQSWGWVQSQNVAYVHSSMMHHWQKFSTWITPTVEAIPIHNLHHQYFFSTRFGDIYPLIKTTKTSYEIAVATRDANQNAVVKDAFIPKRDSTFWPEAAKAKIIASAANQMLGTPYGWGSLYGFRDCSATTENLFGRFGIWLPRNSHDQAKVGEFISLDHLSNPAKEAFIQKQGIPFFTLLWLPGHIVLYIGSMNHDIYIFHSPWGMHTKSLILRKEGRDVIGRAVITPVDLGEHNWLIEHTWLDEIRGMITLVPKNYLKE